MVKLVSYFDDQVKMILPYMNKEVHLDNTKSKTVLGMKYEREAK